MIDGNQLREEFGRYLAEHKATRWGMDAALMHVCKIAYDAGKADGPGAAPLVQNGEVLVTVTGLTGSGKSAIAGEIEIMCRALGLEVEWGEGAAEKHLTHADWTNALEMYRPRVRIVEANIPRTDAALRREVKP